MAFTVSDFTDLTRLLAQHPEWQAELRRSLLSDEFMALPASVRDLAEAQRRTEARLEQLAEAQQRTEARLEQLAEAQQRTEARLEQLAEAQQRTEARLEQLAEAQQRTEARLEQLTLRMDRLAEELSMLGRQVRDLVEGLRRTNTTIGDMRGDLLELRYREHTAGYFGRWLRRAKAVPPVALEDVLEAALSHDELLDVLRLDLLISGRLRDRPDAPEVWLAVEVAAVLNEDDVERAGRRAALLRRAGYRALPVVAGENITLMAESQARAQKVAVIQNGQGLLWEEAMAVLKD